MTISDFDDTFEHIGGFGPFQYIIFSLVCILNCFYTFAYFGQLFMALTPPHHCKLPASLKESVMQHFNRSLSVDEIMHMTIPTVEGGIGFDKCRRFDINFTAFTEQDMDLFNQTDQWPTIDCDNGWEYDFTSYYPSITSQFNWVCSEDWKPPFAQAIFFLGCVLGVPLFGWLADHYGRLPIIIITNIIGGAFGLASSFSRSFTEFCILRFFVGTIFDSNLMIIYILGLEFVSAKYRSIVANVPILVFLTASLCCMPWMAYYLHDWTAFGVVIHAPMLLTVLIIFVAPESVRWLIGKGRTDKARIIVLKAAKINGKTLSEEFLLEFDAYLERSTEVKSEKTTCFDLMKTPVLRKRFLLLAVMWTAIFLAYDGLLRHTEHIGYDFFVTFTIMGAIELPADLLTILLMEWIGRKHTVVWSLIFAGILSIAIVLLDKTEVLKVLLLAASGRFLITMAINVGQQYQLEVLPTAGRAQGSAAIHTLGYGMLFVSPYIVYLSKFHHWIPYAVFGLVSIFGGLSSLWLPETMGEKLPDSLKDGEEFFKDQSIFSNPFKKKSLKLND